MKTKLKTSWLALIFGVLAEALCVAAYYLMCRFDGYHRFFGEFGNPTSFWSSCLVWFHVPGLKLVDIFAHPSFPFDWSGMEWLVVVGVAMLQWFLIFILGIGLFRHLSSKQFLSKQTEG
jgi:hypothetical protein